MSKTTPLVASMLVAESSTKKFASGPERARRNLIVEFDRAHARVERVELEADLDRVDLHRHRVRDNEAVIRRERVAVRSEHPTERDECGATELVGVRPQESTVMNRSGGGGIEVCVDAVVVETQPPHAVNAQTRQNIRTIVSSIAQTDGSE
jgi:hypothetical protein